MATAITSSMRNTVNNKPAVPTVTRFRTNLYAFLELMRELIGLCYEAGNREVNPNWISKIISFLDAFTSEDLIESFVEYSFIRQADGSVDCIWDKIYEKNEEYISMKAGFLFRNLPIPPDKISTFQVLFKSKDSQGNLVINETDRSAIWKYLNSTVKITLTYIHEQRCPKLKKLDDGTMKAVYTRDYRRNIDLKKYLQYYPELELKWE